MHARPLRRLCLVVVAVLHPAPLVAQGVQAPALTVHSIWGTREFASDLVSLTWMKDGTAYTTTQTDSAGHTDLYRVDALSGKTQLLLRGTELVPPGAQQPIAIEEYRFSTDGMRLLIFTNSARVWRQNTKGTYYVWDFTAKRLIPVSAKPGYQMFAKFSPDGRMVAFVRANNIYMTDLATGGETALTADGGDSVINGTSDWVYEEELDLRDAFRWSPDGGRIAFWRFDQTAIPTFYLLDADSLYPQLVPVRYPKAGMPNSEVKIGVVDVGTRQTTWVDLGGDKDIYVAAMDFAGSSNEIWLTRLNRHQDRLDLLLADAQRGASRVIMTDRDSAWVDANQPRWINGGKQFLFVSERDGYDQVYLFNRDGSLLRRVTPGGWDVLQVYGVDEKKQVLYCGGAIDGPLGRPLVRIGLDGKGLARISTEPGTHGIEFDPTFQLYADTYSRTGIPPVQTLRRADGRLVRTLADNAALAAKVTALGLVRPEFITLKTPDGVELNAWIIKPKGFDPSRRYPLLMNVYGGPGSQTVTDSWGGANYLWHQMLARDGYLVASVDNRGTGGRGARFMKMTYLHLHEDDLPPSRPVRDGRPDRGGALVRHPTVRGPRSHRHLGLELRRLHGVAQHVSRAWRVQGRAGGGARDRLALLRHDLYRALHAHARGERVGLRRKRLARVRRQLERQPAPGARHRRRQRALPEQRAPGRAARGRQQAVRHAHLPQQDARHRRRQHAGEPVRPVHGVAEEPPVGRGAVFARGGTALAVLTAINLLNYLDRWIVAALAESMKHSELRLSDAQLGSLMTGFLVVYTATAPLFGSLGDTRARPRLLGLGVAIWSVATALAGFARSFAALFLARAAVGIGEAAYGTISPALLADYYPREE